MSAELDGNEVVCEPMPGFQPQTGTHSEKYTEVAEKVKAMPGIWHKVLICDNSAKAMARAGDIRRGRFTAFRPKGAWEAAAHSNTVMVRYVGAFAPAALRLMDDCR